MTDDAIRKAVADAIHRNWAEYARADFPKWADAVIAAYETALALKCAELEDENQHLRLVAAQLRQLLAGALCAVCGEPLDGGEICHNDDDRTCHVACLIRER